MLARLRREYHMELCNSLLGYRKKSGVLTNADKDSTSSTCLAKAIAENIGLPLCSNPPEHPQTFGAKYASITKSFLAKTCPYLSHIRPGNWTFVVSQNDSGIASYDQYAHLRQFELLLKEADPQIRAALPETYRIRPDILLVRHACSDNELNDGEEFVSTDDHVALHSPLRSSNFKKALPILHACVSTKWTMRSDRAQNSRAEALSLIRYRKGSTPHVAFVTFEPLPRRLASLALGTGDLDCVYHSALYELQKAATDYDGKASQEIERLVEGRRLRDISDLPLDLAI